MAIVRPFKAIRPQKELAEKVAALPYDVMSSEEARAMVKGNPYSFLHIDKAEIDLDESIDLYDIRVYEKARDNLHNMINDKVFLQDDKPLFYIYQQTMKGRTQTGLVATASIDDYLNNVIKKHEHTRADKEQDRIRHVDYCDANTGPIFLTYKHNQEIEKLINQSINAAPEYKFIANDVLQKVWLVVDDEVIAKIQELFSDISDLYIADGHHRSKSAVEVGLQRRLSHPNYSIDDEFNYFLVVLFPDKDLYIMDYNRLVKDLNHHSKEEFLSLVEEKFVLEQLVDSSGFSPTEKYTFGMYLDNSWYKLTARKNTFDSDNPVERLDVSILQNNLLGPILGIDDPRVSDRIDFLGGIRGIEVLQKEVDDNKMVLAFTMYPTAIQDLMDIADAGEVMPPKSTWFEPKLLSGLFIHKLS
ncbi:MAG: DUF1015 domain-containing protein [Syntrophomonadaceae bacterium]|nr:DUF1015 domain-containing protein [Syntrophomonadaceae bacterium]